ncbi:MAG: hypothetical protein M1816_006783 [Peltula sp. TS41687]|nr:MAG: hypothetical protein M1816_006783 [Peltula sp. TS41687]
MPIPPGRPGNLTPEQEAKLREFWLAVLKVFGVFPEQTSLEADGTDHPSVAGSAADPEGNGAPDEDDRHDPAGVEKKKKKRLGLFGKKPHKEREQSQPTSGNVSNLSSTSVDDSEDKYGQTKQFQQALASQTPEDLRTAFWSMVKHDNPDGLLLRFLRARKWDVEKALVMLVSTMHWRAQEMHVDDDVIRLGDAGALEASKTGDSAARKEAEDFLRQMRMGKSYLHGLDKEGRPMCIVRVRLHKQGEQSESSLERYTVYVIETARLLLTGSVDTAAVIFDMTGFSMANMDYAPVRFMIKCFEANYPESLGVVLVHKAPWIFQGIWNIIKGWLDPVVAGKVHFTKHVSDLENFIPKNHILKELGGEEDWSYNYIEPSTDENSRMSDEETKQTLLRSREEYVKRFEQATLRWLSTSSGTASSEEAKAERPRLAEELKKNYWKIDPYLRARSLYDRTGLIKEGGDLDIC